MEDECKMRKTKTFFWVCGFLIAVLFMGCSLLCSGIQNHPENLKLFTNGTIYLNGETKASNLLVKDGVVATYDVAPAKYPKATIVDLAGGFAYPGFCDSHVHLLESAYFFSAGANLLHCQTADDMAKVLAEKIKTLPAGQVVLGLGFSLRDYDKWSLADLAKIDAVTGDRPAFLGDKLGHNAIINSAAIKLVGLTPKSRVPLGGKMGVENGRLTGMLRESALITPVNKLFPLFDKNEIKASTQKMAQQWAAIGYTGIVDLMGGPGARFMRPEVYYELEKEGRLPLRVNFCYTIFNLTDVTDAVKYRGKDTDLVRFLGVKIFVDGAYAGGQAWTSWPNKLGNHGLQEIYTDDVGGPELNLNRIVAQVEEYGMNMHYHVQGDLAIDAVLNALDQVHAKNGKLNGVHTLIHLAYPTDQQIERIKNYGGKVVTTVQPGFWPVERDTAYYYGEMAKKAYPIKKLIDSGISVGISTDFSVSPPEYTPATEIIGIAVTGAGDPKNHQPLTVKDVLVGLAEGSAKTTGKNDVGRLEVGYKADLVVFARDLYDVPKTDFNQTHPPVIATYLSGKQAYRRP